MASYTQLKDKSWGIRVDGTATVGQSVTVTKKNGETKTETVKRVLRTGKDSRTGQIVSLCAIEQRQYASSNRGRGSSDCCWGNCPVTGRKCTPSDPCHDCQ